MLKNFLKGFVVGSVAGGVGTLLTVPRSGNETREKLARELELATETTLELNTRLTNFKNALQTTQKTAQELIPAFTSGLQQDITEFKFQAQPRVAQIKDQVETLTEHVDAFTNDTLSTTDMPIVSKES
ncbi:hypothetical protein EsVE80_03020 [Enterococcus saigonensis]|uniref:General stress protein n=1 Tax=Enterococcus saigonensis TaxID=1805431 RepID=A0A679I9S1_9ENTE|nr:YtxH domain-containing protein [Enterococcus saigonensis]BCA84779.1 hypothetical protein EsVE80_03020 [Enterococcus saigonensis]